MSDISVKEVLEQIPAFVKHIEFELKGLGIDVKAYPVDHVCFRVKTWAEYEKYKIEFSKVGKLLSEAQIGGRPIATYQFHQAIKAGDRLIPCIELPAPKAGKEYPTALEHCEFVISQSFVSFAAVNSGLAWDWAGSKKVFNPELGLQLAPGLAVKFHHMSLMEVIRLEESAKQS